MNWIKRLFKKPKKIEETFEELLMNRCEYQYNLITKCQVPNDIDPTSFYLGFICGAKEATTKFKDEEE